MRIKHKKRHNFTNGELRAKYKKIKNNVFEQYVCEPDTPTR